MPDVKTLYDQDFVTWAEQQAEALRAAGRGTTNQPLDWENLAEEIEDLPKGTAASCTVRCDASSSTCSSSNTLRRLNPAQAGAGRSEMRARRSRM